MNKLKFATNIKCAACIAAVKPQLNGLNSIEDWQVDLTSPERILTISTKPDFDEHSLHMALESAGYKAEKQ